MLEFTKSLDPSQLPWVSAPSQGADTGQHSQAPVRVLTPSQPDSETQCSSTKASHSGQLFPEGEAEGARVTLQAEGYTKEDTSTGSRAGSRAETQRPRPVCTGLSLRHPGPGNGPMDGPLRGLTGLVWPVFSHPFFTAPDSCATS